MAMKFALLSLDTTLAQKEITNGMKITLPRYKSTPIKVEM
jgi:hypothetical protein